MKLIIIPVINGATRIVTKGLKKNLEAIIIIIIIISYTWNITHNTENTAV
jgi:hypothetical protein